VVEVNLVRSERIEFDSVGLGDSLRYLHDERSRSEGRRNRRDRS